MSCILCIRILNDKINIFDDEGIRLDIANVITKHFWLQPNAEDVNKRIICCSCWNTLQSFNKFYHQIETAHFNLANVKRPDATEDNLPKNDDFHRYPELFKEVAVSDIKSESSFDDNEANSQNIDVELEKPEDNATRDEIKSESDFGSLLFKLRKHRKPTSVYNTEQSVSDSDDSDEDPPLRNKSQTQKPSDCKVTLNKERPENTSISLRESNKRTVSCKQFDAFIKQNMKLSCNICSIPLENFFALKEHYRSAHNEIGYVTCCEKKFDSRHALVHHITMHKNPETFKCEKCGRILADNRGLKRHMNTTHVNEERIHQCHICKKGFRRKELLERHLKTHVKREHICEQCGRVFRGKQNFRQHQLRDHSGIPKERLQCKKCGVHLADASTLHTHMKYQHPVTVVVHECTICGKISSTGYGLKRHIQYMHTRGRPHKCTLCEKAFKTLKCLRDNEFVFNLLVKMLCLLCLTKSEEIIKIFDEKGLELDVQNVILQHFWLQPSVEDTTNALICYSCWDALDAFHKFYKKVVQAHAGLKSANVKLPTDDLSVENIDVSVPKTVSSQDIKLEPYVNAAVNVYATPPKIKSDDSDSDVGFQQYAGSDSNHSDDSDNSMEGSVSNREKQSVKTSDHGSDENPKPNSTSKELKTIPCKQFDEFIKKNMKLSCDICQVPLDNFFAFKEHYRSEHKQVGYVTCCKKKFDSRHALVHHILLHTNPDTFKCKKCGRVLADHRGLKRHMNTTHVNEERIHKCEKCKKRFRRIELLERHLKTHVKRQHVCDQCGKVVRGKQLFHYHMQNEHSGIPRVPKKRVQCQQCGAHLCDSSSLARHVNSVHPTTTVVHDCNICGKISATAYGLKRHIEYMHTLGRRHKCTLCDSAFKTLKRLRVS